MMRIIMHNSISLDSCYTGFEVDMGLHYQIAGWFQPDIHIIGSATAKSGAEMAGSIPDEEPGDFVKQHKDGPIWVIVDSKGLTMGMLHAIRRSPYCGNVVVLVSRKTKKAFIEYLKKRQYDYIFAGDKKVDLKKALAELERRYGSETAIVDSGPGLTSAMLGAKLIDEVSLIICPESVGGDRLFDSLPPLHLMKAKGYGDFAWLHYKVLK
jgi:2,5-diamino-6-(ribosylamino)-4(3H)-pyrimidinone 5'-phosphate reductase